MQTDNMSLSRNDKTEKIRRVDLFSELNDAELEQVSAILYEFTASAGQNIIKEGEKGRELYILYEGNVEIKKKTMHEDEEYTVINLPHTADAFFGELALIDNDLRSATVTANVDSKFLVMKSENFDSLCNVTPAIGNKLYKKLSQILSKRLRKANKDIITLFEALVLEIRKDV